jgi:hypothetical protein
VGDIHITQLFMHRETNLKTFRSLPETAEFEEKDLITLSGTIEVESPTNNLYSFRGNITTPSISTTGLNEKQLLLRVHFISHSSSKFIEF